MRQIIRRPLLGLSSGARLTLVILLAFGWSMADVMAAPATKPAANAVVTGHHVLARQLPAMAFQVRSGYVVARLD